MTGILIWMAGRLDGLAIQARLGGRFGAAVRLHRTSLRLGRRALRPSDPRLAMLLNGYGVACKYFGLFEAGEAAYREALAILAVHPAKAFDRATILHNLGGIQYASGRFVEAETTARMGIEIRASLSGSDNATAILADKAAHAAILHGLKRLDDAERCLTEVIAGWEEVAGPDHYEVAVNANNLAAVLAEKGELEEAEELYGRALRLKERALGPNHPDVAITLNNVAVLRRRRGDAAGASALGRRALTILEKRLSTAHPHLTACRRNLRLAVEELENPTPEFVRSRASAQPISTVQTMFRSGS